MSFSHADIIQKYGRPNEATPAKWNAEYKDFTVPLENGTAPPPQQIKTGAAASTAPTAGEQAEAGAVEAAAIAIQATEMKEESATKKRKHEETAEEKAERKRKKKEKKEKRKSKE